MSFSHKTMICAVVITSLGACGGGGGGTSGASAAAAALDYDPVFATTETPSVGAAVTSAGATGLVAIYDVLGDRVVFQNVKTRTNSAGTIGYLSINGAPEITLPLGEGDVFGTPERNFFFGITGTDDIRDVWSNILPDGDIGLGRGFVGVETTLADLPAGATTFEGDFNASLFQTGLLTMGVDGFLGEITLVTNFDTLALSGRLDEGFTTIGTISGSTQGNGILGTVTLTSASDYSGSFEIIGKVFGDDGGTLAGVMGGSNVVQDGTNDTYHLFGEFDAYKQP